MLAPVEHTRPECCIFSITKGLGNDDNVHYYFFCYNFDFFFSFSIVDEWRWGMLIMWLLVEVI